MVHVKKGVQDSRIRGFKWLLFDDSTCALSNFPIALSLSFLHAKMGFQIEPEPSEKMDLHFTFNVLSIMLSVHLTPRILEPLSPLGIDSIRFRNYLSPFT